MLLDPRMATVLFLRATYEDSSHWLLALVTLHPKPLAASSAARSHSSWTVTKSKVESPFFPAK